jgi:hypothetical protein
MPETKGLVLIEFFSIFLERSSRLNYFSNRYSSGILSTGFHSCTIQPSWDKIGELKNLHFEFWGKYDPHHQRLSHLSSIIVRSGTASSFEEDEETFEIGDNYG